MDREIRYINNLTLGLLYVYVSLILMFTHTETSNLLPCCSLFTRICVVPVIVIVRCKAVGLRPLACCDCGFESLMGQGCLSFMSVVCVGLIARL